MLSQMVKNGSISRFQKLSSIVETRVVGIMQDT